jgi:hypothetical protein
VASPVLFVVAYLIGVASLIWVNTAVLCLGDPKFGYGCGGFDLYFMVWAVSYAPIAVTALLLTWVGRVRRHPRVRAGLLLAYLVLIMSALEWSFVNDIEWPAMLIEWGILVIAFLFLRWLALRRWAPQG